MVPPRPNSRPAVSHFSRARFLLVSSVLVCGFASPALAFKSISIPVAGPTVTAPAVTEPKVVVPESAPAQVKKAIAKASGSESAYISADGRTAVPPKSAPEPVKQVVYAANRLVYKPYCQGGGHWVSSRGWEQSCYDCSGSVSYALHGGGFLSKALDTGSFGSWGQSGPGRWITVWTKSGHTYAVIAGLRFDTQPRYPEKGEHAPRWRRTLWYGDRFVARHPAGY
jgi:hypothetical protein